jgi:hypothetical protein
MVGSSAAERRFRGVVVAMALWCGVGGLVVESVFLPFSRHWLFVGSFVSTSVSSFWFVFFVFLCLMAAVLDVGLML